MARCLTGKRLSPHDVAPMKRNSRSNLPSLAMQSSYRSDSWDEFGSSESALSILKRIWEGLQPVGDRPTSVEYIESFERAIDEADVLLQDINDDELFGICALDNRRGQSRDDVAEIVMANTGTKNQLLVGAAVA